MAATLKQTEADAGQSAIWQRIEAYIAHRFAARSVQWIVEGPGEWAPPLTPATITAAEIWTGSDWEALSPAPAPLGGFWLTGQGPYRFSATVGAGPVPAAVQEAHDRLTAYLDALPGSVPGARSVTIGIPDVEQTTIERDATWIARAMINSGAADLLRPYRRA